VPGGRAGAWRAPLIGCGIGGVAGCCLAVGMPDLVLACAAALALAAVAWRDFAELRIPDMLVVMLAVGAMLQAALGSAVDLADAAIGAAALYAIGLGAAVWARRHQCELGPGDTKLMAVCGAWLGVTAGALVAPLACFTAAVIIAVRSREQPGAVVLLPFGTLLAPFAALAILGAAIQRAL